MGDVAVDEGQKLRITTPVKGNPIPEFSWTKEGAPIDSDRVHFFSGKLILKLFSFEFAKNILTSGYYSVKKHKMEIVNSAQPLFNF